MQECEKIRYMKGHVPPDGLFGMLMLGLLLFNKLVLLLFDVVFLEITMRSEVERREYEIANRTQGTCKQSK